jgi:aminoglycoside phosphotransferase (APT) family kinase protein
MNMTDMGSQLANEIAAAFLHEKIHSVHPIIGKGSVNKIFIVGAARSKVVIRMNHDGMAFKDYEKECWCMEKAIAKGIPSPLVLAMGQKDDVAYMIQSYVDGEHGENSSFENKYLWTKLGQYAKLIHSIKVIGFGEILSDPLRGTFYSPTHDNFDGTWLDFVRYNIESLTVNDELIKLGVLTAIQSKSVKRLFENLQEREFHFGLNHGDISLKNTIVNQNGHVTLLDWGSAEVNIAPHGDFIQLMKCHIEMNNPSASDILAFIDGYGIAPDDFRKMQEEINILLVLRAFDKLRWAIDRSPQRIPNFAGYAKKVLKRVLG